MSVSHPPKISEAEVKKVASLARLHINDQEVSTHVTNLSNILELIAHINAKDTNEVTPMASPFANTTLALREDEITEKNEREQLLKLAPLTESGLYLVPQVIE